MNLTPTNKNTSNEFQCRINAFSISSKSTPKNNISEKWMVSNLFFMKSTLNLDASTRQLIIKMCSIKSG